MVHVQMYLLKTPQREFWKTVGWLKFSGGAVVKNPPANAGNSGDASSIAGLGRSPEVSNSNQLQFFLPEKFHGQRSLAGYSLWGHKESDMTKCAHSHIHRFVTRLLLNRSMVNLILNYLDGSKVILTLQVGKCISGVKDWIKDLYNKNELWH